MITGALWCRSWRKLRTSQLTSIPTVCEAAGFTLQVNLSLWYRLPVIPFLDPFLGELDLLEASKAVFSKKTGGTHLGETSGDPCSLAQGDLIDFSQRKEVASVIKSLFRFTKTTHALKTVKSIHVSHGTPTPSLVFICSYSWRTILIMTKPRWWRSLCISLLRSTYIVDIVPSLSKLTMALVVPRILTKNLWNWWLSLRECQRAYSTRTRYYLIGTTLTLTRSTREHFFLWQPPGMVEAVQCKNAQRLSFQRRGQRTEYHLWLSRWKEGTIVPVFTDWKPFLSFNRSFLQPRLLSFSSASA